MLILFVHVGAREQSADDRAFEHDGMHRRIDENSQNEVENNNQVAVYRPRVQQGEDYGSNHRSQNESDTHRIKHPMRERQEFKSSHGRERTESPVNAAALKRVDDLIHDSRRMSRKRHHESDPMIRYRSSTPMREREHGKQQYRQDVHHHHCNRPGVSSASSIPQKSMKYRDGKEPDNSYAQRNDGGFAKEQKRRVQPAHKINSTNSRVDNGSLTRQHVMQTSDNHFNRHGQAPYHPSSKRNSDVPRDVQLKKGIKYEVCFNRFSLPFMW